MSVDATPRNSLASEKRKLWQSGGANELLRRRCARDTIAACATCNSASLHSELGPHDSSCILELTESRHFDASSPTHNPLTSGHECLARCVRCLGRSDLGLRSFVGIWRCRAFRTTQQNWRCTAGREQCAPWPCALGSKEYWSEL